MRLFAVAALAALGASVSGCATVFEGVHQNISVVTNPPGAKCVFVRQGMQVGVIEATPGTASIRKSKYDIIIKCNKPGYQESQYLNHSGTTATIAANVAADLLLTWGVSSAIDSADGADNKYEAAVNLTLTPNMASSGVPGNMPPLAVSTESVSASSMPVRIYCSNPLVEGLFETTGTPGYLRATVRFDINGGDDTGAVGVAPGNEGRC